MSNINASSNKGVNRTVFFVLFGVVVLALIALAVAQFVNGSPSHTAAAPTTSTGTLNVVAPAVSGAPQTAPATTVPLTQAATGSTRTFNAGTYHVKRSSFVKSFIDVPTSNVAQNSSTISSQYLVGTAPVYDAAGHKVGTYSATFVTLQTANGISTNTTSYFSVGGGLVATWATPKKVANLTLNTVAGSVVSKGTLVSVATKVSGSKYFGDSFDLVIKASGGNLYFAFDRAN